MPYDRRGLYHDPADSRLFVPKRNPVMGWTVNVDHRLGPLVLAGLGLVVIAGLAAVFLVRR